MRKAETKIILYAIKRMLFPVMLRNSFIHLHVIQVQVHKISIRITLNFWYNQPQCLQTLKFYRIFFCLFLIHMILSLYFTCAHSKRILMHSRNLIDWKSSKKKKEKQKTRRNKMIKGAKEARFKYLRFFFFIFALLFLI